jgi:predicted phage-related endonuclease
MGNEAVEITMTDRMYELALDYESTIREIKDLEARKDALGNGIRDLMPGPGKAARDNAKVSWSMVKATRLDTKALTEAHPSVVKPFMVTSESPRLTVSVKELS